jgi:hypothetical protein
MADRLAAVRVVLLGMADPQAAKVVVHNLVHLLAVPLVARVALSSAAHPAAAKVAHLAMVVDPLVDPPVAKVARNLVLLPAVPPADRAW